VLFLFHQTFHPGDIFANEAAKAGTPSQATITTSISPALMPVGNEKLKVALFELIAPFAVPSIWGNAINKKGQGVTPCPFISSV
jgi:hypothetical protein